MTTPSVVRPPSFLARLRDRGEELIYKLNERNHWMFRLYDWSNELLAAVCFRGVRSRAALLDNRIRIRTVLEARIRFLTPDDEGAFAVLLSKFDSRYLPPHAIDRDSAARALRRRSYLPFGIFIDERLVGYLLLRWFFPRRVVTGIWSLPETHNLGLGQESLRQTATFTRSERIPDYATIPVDNVNSVRVANAAGWETIRTNRRFHVLLLR